MRRRNYVLTFWTCLMNYLLIKYKHQIHIKNSLPVGNYSNCREIRRRFLYDVVSISYYTVRIQIYMTNRMTVQ
jgi:hypothetical protein